MEFSGSTRIIVGIPCKKYKEISGVVDPDKVFAVETSDQSVILECATINQWNR